MARRQLFKLCAACEMRDRSTSRPHLRETASENTTGTTRPRGTVARTDSSPRAATARIALPAAAAERRISRELTRKKKMARMRERRDDALLSDVSAWAALLLVLIAHGASVCDGGMGTLRHAWGGSVAEAVCQRRRGVPHLQDMRLIQVHILGSGRARARQSHTELTRVISVHACT